ncbi:hypothetical protein [Streptomyces subrutilus]
MQDVGGGLGVSVDDGLPSRRRDPDKEVNLAAFPGLAGVIGG